MNEVTQIGRESGLRLDRKVKGALPNDSLTVGGDVLKVVHDHKHLHHHLVRIEQGLHTNSHTDKRMCIY